MRWMLIICCGVLPGCLMPANDGPLESTKRAQDLLAAGDVEAAADAFAESYAADPDDYWNAARYAEVLYRLQRVGEARRVLEDALEEHPEVGALYFSLANLEHNEGDLELAEDLFRKTIRRLPNFIEAYVYLGTILRERGDLDSSMQVLATALSVDERNLPVNFELAQTLEAGGDYRAREQWDFYARLNLERKGPEAELNTARKRLRALPLTITRNGARYLLDGIRQLLTAAVLPEPGTLPPEHLVPEELRAFFDNPVFARLHVPGLEPLTVVASSTSLQQACLDLGYSLRALPRFTSFRRRLNIDATLVLHVVNGPIERLRPHVDGAGRVISEPALEHDEGIVLHRDGELLGWWLPGDGLMRGPSSLGHILASLGEEVAGAPEFWRRPGVELYRLRTRSWLDGAEVGDLGELARGLPVVLPPTQLELESAVERAGKFLVRLQTPAGRIPAAYELGRDRITSARSAVLEEAAAVLALVSAADVAAADLFLPSAQYALDALALLSIEQEGQRLLPAEPEGGGQDAAALAATALYSLACLRGGQPLGADFVTALRSRMLADGSFLLPPLEGLPEGFDLAGLLRLALLEQALRAGQAERFGQLVEGFQPTPGSTSFWQAACLQFLTRSAPETEPWRLLAVELFAAFPRPQTTEQRATSLLLFAASGEQRASLREAAIDRSRELLERVLTTESAYFCAAPGRANGAVLGFTDPRQIRGWPTLVTVWGLQAAHASLQRGR